MLDRLGALVTILDRQGRIRWVNRLCEQTTGLSFEDVWGRPVWEVLVLPEEGHRVRDALANPRWSLYLGRKCCPPALPVFVSVGRFAGLDVALCSEPWCPRDSEDIPRDEHRKRCETIDLNCLIEWQPGNGETTPAEAEVWYDVPVWFNPQVHEPRLVLRQRVVAEVRSRLALC